MRIFQINNSISFEGHHQLMKKVRVDFYTGKQVPIENRSTEHIVPRSKGGASNIKNYAMIDKNVNCERGNLDLPDWLKIHPDFFDNMKSYVKRYYRLKLGDVFHGETIIDTIRKAYGIDLLMHGNPFKVK